MLRQWREARGKTKEGIMEDNLMRGIIDMHIHAAPDVRERRLDDLDLMEASVERGVRAIVIKSHMVPTADRATLVNRIVRERYGTSTNFEMFGAISLNRSVGGLNPYALEAALKLGAKVVWLPTNTAENHLAKNGKTGGVAVVRDGRAVSELGPIFELVKEYDAVLATGHISGDECFPVVEAARDAGVEKLVITHPEFWVVGMTQEQMARIVADYDVLLESEYAQPIGGGKYKINLPDNAANMRAIGPEHFIVSTDSGQLQNPYWYESYPSYIRYLLEHGITAEEVDVMTKANPARMLGISL